MQPGARRRARNSAVVAGSVWEKRMKMDEVKGGIKVFNAQNQTNAGDEAQGIRAPRRLRRNQSDGDGGAATDNAQRRKRRNWKPPEAAAESKSPIQLRKARSEIPSRDVDEDEEEDEEEDEIEIEGEIIKDFDDKEIDLPPPLTKSKLVEVEEDNVKKIQEIVSEMPVSLPPPEEIEEDLNPVKMEAQPSKIIFLKKLF